MCAYVRAYESCRASNRRAGNEMNGRGVVDLVLYRCKHSSQTKVEWVVIN